METTVNTPVSLSLSELTNKIDLRKATDKLRVQNEISRLMTMQSLMDTAVSKVEEKLPSIVAALDSMGLGVSEFGYGKTGMDSKTWNDGDCIRVNITAVPTSNKFRFILDQGYDSRGRGKNQNRLNEKANKMSAVITEKTGIGSVQINPFSLEIKNAGDTKRVLVELWIK